MRKTIFKGRLLAVGTEKVRLPNGHKVDLEIVEHPGAVLIVPFLNKNRVIILKQYRPVIRSYIYEFPAGTLEKGESSLKCAKREIIEETGHTAGKLTRLGKIFPVPGYSTEKIVIDKAEKLIKKERMVQVDEIIEIKIMTRKEILALFKNGRIVDAKTICALAFCGWL